MVLIDPCESAELKIDTSVFADPLPLVYNIGMTNAASVYDFDSTRVDITPSESASLCPPIVLDVVYDYEKSIQSGIFAFDSTSNELMVATAD